jgi:hypothetical protein
MSGSFPAFHYKLPYLDLTMDTSLATKLGSEEGRCLSSSDSERVSRFVDVQERKEVMDQFEHLSLARQHQQLLADIVRIDVTLEELARNQLGEAKRLALRSGVIENLEGFIHKLKAHFFAESINIGKSFYNERPMLHDALRELEREHPDLLGRFGHALRGFERGTPYCEHELEQAIDAFRTHEAREDSLFAEY